MAKQEFQSPWVRPRPEKKVKVSTSNKERHVTGDIRQQLLKQGVKESPLMVVERLWHSRNEWLNKPIWNNRYRAVVEQRVKELDERILKICIERRIGNPLNGEAIEWKK